MEENHRDQDNSLSDTPNPKPAPPAEADRVGMLLDARIEHRSIASLALRRNNPRTHSEKQIRQIAASIKTFGFTNPILIDASATVIAGHGRVRAAKQLGMETVPTLRLEHLSEEQVRAYVIADNRLAECAGWDHDLLAIELQWLSEIELEFDLEVIGFDAPEIDLLIGGKSDETESDPADELPESSIEHPAVTRPGDLWQIGPHRLLCGDALNKRTYEELFGRKEAHVVFVDPPYNVPIDGHVSGLGRARHDEFAMASGEMSEAEFIAFLERALAHHAAYSRNGSLHFVCMDWRHSAELLTATREIYSEQKNVCVWVKTNAGMGSLYRSQHEFVHVFKVGDAPHTNNVELGKHGRSRSNVWRYAGANSFGHDRDNHLAIHPTVKPVRLVADAILDCTKRGNRVLDGFAGSGTTLLAAERTGRVGYGIELEPRYVDTTIRRLAEHAGLEAIHAESGLTFDELAALRAAESETPPASEPTAATPSDEDQR